jgi:hypothetical protein
LRRPTFLGKAIVAVANKLLKQAFTIAKSGFPYDENYVSRLN